MRAAAKSIKPSESGRALVPAGSSAQAPFGPPGSRPSAMFLAQLIAVAQQVPQTRQRRRAEPNEANSAYAAVSKRPAWIGRAVCRSS
jgi:hypothetical protein